MFKNGKQLFHHKEQRSFMNICTARLMTKKVRETIDFLLNREDAHKVF